MSEERFSAKSCAGTVVLVLALGMPAGGQLPDKPPPLPIAAELPYRSHYVEVLGSKMHYIDEGEGSPIVFLHGNPTSAYLWRNVIPYLVEGGRCIAVDLIGMGRSDKPELDYRYVDHRKYLEIFLSQLELDDVTLVLHDWGTVLGFDWAIRHEDAVLGIAFMEAIVPPAFPLPSFEAMGPAGTLFRSFRDPEEGRRLILEQNLFVEQILPGAVVRELTAEEMDHYRAPYPDPQSRKPTLAWPRELPIGGEPVDTTRVVEAVGRWMTRTDVPMLHIWAKPGAINDEEVARYFVENVKDIQSTFIGRGIHYLQEDHPEVIGRAIADWRRRLLERR